MCRSVNLKPGEYGPAGRRCNCDSSEARRLRRKAAKAIATHSTSLGFTIQDKNEVNLVAIEQNTPTLTFTFEEAKLEAESLKVLYQQPLPEGYLQEQWDAELELRSTAVGYAIAAEAERTAGIDYEVFHSIKNQLEERIVTFVELNKNNPEWKKHLEDEKNGMSTTVISKELQQKILKKAELKKELAEHSTRASVLLAESYRETLSQLRPMGGELVADYDEPLTADFMEEEVTVFYPEKWLEVSAETGTLQVHEVEGVRPSYRSASSRSVKHAIVPSGFNLTDNSKESPGVHIIKTGIELNEELNIATSITSVDAIVIQDRTPYNALTDGPKDSQGKPTTLKNGETWHYGTLLPEVLSSTGDTKSWYTLKPIITPATGVGILSFEAADGTYDENLSPVRNLTAIHETGHRMAEVIPNRALIRAEAAFIKRRTTDPHTLKQEKLGLISSPEKTQAKINGNLIKSEIGYKDNFIHHYVGRQYLTQDAYEVFTVGMESLFGHSNGGLVGLQKENQQDKNHRAFTLGVLASI